MRKNGLFSSSASNVGKFPVVVPPPREGPRNGGYRPLDDRLAPLQVRKMSLEFGFRNERNVGGQYRDERVI